MKFSFKDWLEIIESGLSIIVSLGAIIGFIMTYNSDIVKKAGEIIEKAHQEYIMIDKE